jgi:hypothetical protein
VKLAHVMLVIAPTLVAPSLHAKLVQVQMTGTVEFNIANPTNPNTNPDILAIQVGQTLTYSFNVDSDVYQNSGSFPVRGYEIIQNSFLVTTSGGFSTGLVNPFPGGATPYFVLRNNDPAVDGFYLTWGGVDFPGGLPIDEPGLFGDPFEAHFSVGYSGDTLDSLDILAAQGTYAYGDGGPGTLTNFYFNLVDLGFEVVGIDYSSMTISVVPAPAGGLALLASLGLVRRRRRRD